MNVKQEYQQWKPTVLHKRIGDGECVSLVVNNPASYVEHLWRGINWEDIIKPVPAAKDLPTAASAKYLHWIANDHNDPNQLPQQGDIMVFGPTPHAGYSDKFDNPYGHTGVCDSADSNGYSLLQQNAPAFGASVNVTRYPWRYRPCRGWFRPILTSSPARHIPVTHEPTSKTIYLPPTTGPWHLYKENGPYNPAVPGAVKGVLYPSYFGGLTYNIVADKGDGVYVIKTQDFGRGALWTRGSDVVVK